MKKAIQHLLDFIEKIQYETAIFLFLLLRGLPLADLSNLKGWQTMSYVLSYKNGFFSRGLIGTIFRFIFPDFVTSQNAALFVNATVILDCLITALILGGLLRAAKKRDQLMLAAVPVVVYLCVPINITTYFSAGQHAGKLEIFLFPLMMLSAWILMKTTPGIKQTVYLSIISIISLLIYQNYIFLCFPLILALIIYNLFDYGWSRRNVILAGIICAVTGLTFIYLQLFAKINAADAASLTAELRSQTDMVIWEEAVFYEYFASFKDFYVDLMLYRYDYQLEVLLFDLILLSPAIAVYVFIWFHAFRNCKEKKEKQLLILLQLCSLVFLPTYIITCDWARWSIWFIIFQVSLVLILWFKKSEPMLCALNKTCALIKKYNAVAAFIIIYFLSLTTLSVTEMFTISKTLYGIVFN